MSKTTSEKPSREPMLPYRASKPKIDRIQKAADYTYFRSRTEFLDKFFDECLEPFTKRYLRPGVSKVKL